MGDLKDMRRVGKPAKRGDKNELPPGVILDPSVFVNYQGKKLKGELVVTLEGLYCQGVRSAGIGKSVLLRVPLVRWEDVRRIEIDGREFERRRGQSMIGVGAGGAVGVGRVGSSYTAAQSHLVLTTDTEQLAYSLPISPVHLRNILGEIIVAIENQTLGSDSGDSHSPRHCPQCSRETADDIAFCPYCGSPLPNEPEEVAAKSCSACLQDVPADSVFCPNCGTAFASAEKGVEETEVPAAVEQSPATVLIAGVAQAEGQHSFSDGGTPEPSAAPSAATPDAGETKREAGRKVSRMAAAVATGGLSEAGRAAAKRLKKDPAAALSPPPASTLPSPPPASTLPPPPPASTPPPPPASP